MTSVNTKVNVAEVSFGTKLRRKSAPAAGIYNPSSAPGDALNDGMEARGLIERKKLPSLFSNIYSILERQYDIEPMKSTMNLTPKNPYINSQFMTVEPSAPYTRAQLGMLNAQGVGM
jgi:hypothetical protein